jgi:hypothetical protein
VLVPEFSSLFSVVFSSPSKPCGLKVPYAQPLEPDNIRKSNEKSVILVYIFDSLNPNAQNSLI